MNRLIENVGQVDRRKEANDARGLLPLDWASSSGGVLWCNASASFIFTSDSGDLMWLQIQPSLLALCSHDVLYAGSGSGGGCRLLRRADNFEKQKWVAGVNLLYTIDMGQSLPHCSPTNSGPVDVGSSLHRYAYFSDLLMLLIGSTRGSNRKPRLH